MGCPSSVEIGDNLVFSITCHDPDTSILTDADSLPIYRIYEDETPTPILTGVMSKLDDSNTTGFYTKTIACTSGNGFESGKTYTIYITATVNLSTGAICYGCKVTDILTTLFSDGTIPEDYPGIGVDATPAQLLYLILQSLHEFAITGTTRKVKKLDGSTIAAEFTLDSDSAPTSTTRSA